MDATVNARSASRDGPGQPAHPPSAMVRMGRWLLGHLVRHNPAYLISAALMLAGVYTIIRPGEQELGNLPAILATYSIFQVYELLLVGIALLLIRRLRVLDDGATLVLVEAAFVVGSFVILDEVMFRDGYLVLGFALGVVAALLATCRLAALALGGGLGRPTRLSVLAILALLFGWNVAMPARLAQARLANDPRTDALYLVGWWALAGLVLILAILAARRQPRAGPRERAFVNSPWACWAVTGIVVLVSAFHHNRIGYILDIPLVLSDTIPFAAALSIGVVNLLAWRRRVGRLEHVVAALPAVLCVAALVTGQFGSLGPWRWRALGMSAHFTEEMRMLCWPPAWLAATAVLTLLHALRRRSGAFAHQAAVLAVVAAGFAETTRPGRLEISTAALVVAVAAYFAVNAVVYRSPAWAVACLTVVNVAIRRALPGPMFEAGREPLTAPTSLYVPPNIVVAGTLGASCFVLWVVFRERVPKWLAHIGAALMLLAVAGASFSPATRASSWVLAAVAFALAAVLVLVARRLGWWPYYALAIAAVCVPPGRLISRSDATTGAPSGWLLIVGSFAALGLGLLFSSRKARTPHTEGPGHLAEPS